MADISIKEFAERFKRGEFNSRDISTQIEAGWFDWFCNPFALAKKTQMLGKKVLSIMNYIDTDNNYVFFKNNCPVVGALYDQFSICDLASGDVLYCCQHLEKGSHGCDKAHWEIYGRENDFENPIVEGDWNTCRRWFKEHTGAN